MYMHSIMFLSLCIPVTMDFLRMAYNPFPRVVVSWGPSGSLKCTLAWVSRDLFPLSSFIRNLPHLSLSSHVDYMSWTSFLGHFGSHLPPREVRGRGGHVSESPVIFVGASVGPEYCSLHLRGLRLCSNTCTMEEDRLPLLEYSQVFCLLLSGLPRHSKTCCTRTPASLNPLTFTFAWDWSTKHWAITPQVSR